MFCMTDVALHGGLVVVHNDSSIPGGHEAGYRVGES